MATKELEILVRAKDAATGVLKNVSNSAKSAGKDASDAGRKSQDAFSNVFRGVARGASILVLFRALADGVNSYHDAIQKGESVTLAKGLGIEATIQALPVLSQVYDITQKILGIQSYKAQEEAADAILKLKIEVNDLAAAYRAVSLAERASRPGVTDASKFGLVNQAELEKQNADLEKRRLAISLERDALNSAIKNSDNNNKLLNGASAISPAFGLLADWAGVKDANKEQIALNKGKLKDLDTELSYLDKIKAKNAEIAKNKQNEFDHKDNLRLAEARVNAELKLAAVTGATRRQLLTDYKQDLQAELDALQQNLQDKTKAITLAARKEMEGKSAAEKDLIGDRATAEINALRTQTNVLSGKAYRQDLFRQRDENIARQEKSYETSSKLRGILIEGLEREASLGSINAKIEADRLKITQETADKRKELLAILTDENSSMKDRAAASIGLNFLSGDEQRRKALAGMQGVFQGSTASANTSYFGSGVQEASRERQIVNPLLKEQREANAYLKAQLDLLNDLPTALKSLGIGFLVGKF